MKRQHRDIYACVLAFCKTKPQIETHIMYKCNMSFQQIKQNLIELIGIEFLEELKKHHQGKERKCFLTTEKGRKWLAAFTITVNLEGGEKKHEQNQETK